MRSLKSHVLSLFTLAALLAGTCAFAQKAAPQEEGPSYSPFAANAWAGIAFDYLHESLGGASDSTSKLGAAFGGDVGLRFTPSFAVVALAEYAPIISGESFGGHFYTLGGGIRYQNQVANFILAGGYSNLGSDAGNIGGFGVKLIGTYPVFLGFGPYLQLAFHSFSDSGLTLNVFTANTGISFSW